MNSDEHDAEDLQPRNALCRSPSYQPRITPSVPEVSLVFSNTPWVNDRTATTSTHSTPGYLCHETSVQERRNMVPSTGHGRENLNCGSYKSYSSHEDSKLLQHSTHKRDGISGKTNSDYFNLSRANILRDNRTIETEVVTNSNRTFLPRTFLNKCNTPNRNRDIHSVLQSSCSSDSSVSNRKYDRFLYQHSGSPKIVSNEHDRSVWHDVNSPRNSHGFMYSSKSTGDEYGVAKSKYKMHPKKKSSGQKFPSDREDEEQNKCYFNKETSSPQQQMTCLRVDPLYIPQERTRAECSASMQNSVPNDQEDIVTPLPCSSLPHEQGKDRGVKLSPGADLRCESQFQFRFLTHQTGNCNLETDGRNARNPTQCMNVRDISEDADTSYEQLKKVKELDSNDKSLSDLYSLIHSQNEQLRHLQAQVDTLLLTRDTSSSAATPVCTSIQSLKKHVQVVDESTQTVITDIHCDAAVSTDPTPVVSVGVMTTLTDAADSQQPQDMKRTDQHNRKPRSGNSSVCYHSSVHVPESHDETICFNSLELSTVQEQAPSPVSSIHVDMHDYEDDEEDDDDIAQEMDSCKEDNSQQRNNEGLNRIGWTFYNNVVGQVNKLLKDLPHDSDPRNRCDDEHDSRRLNKNEEDVKNATMDQLRKMGISFHNACSSDVPVEVRRVQQFDSLHCPRLDIVPIATESSESDTSIHINALALKYLNHNEQGKQADRMQDVTFYNVAMKTTNLSLGTLKYLERYHLLPSQGDANGGVVRIKESNKLCHNAGERIQRLGSARGDTKAEVPYQQLQSSTDKILDITTLKKQPKLL
ncbi:hypothetical protein B7P43_G07017 [Cryptotermes secundus]|uniref:Uncharacterized protein n=1 Tax=Cryptotermes secundus TaxID=105785 RepID=A0A2J7PEN9_9NEOP|nr:uncharacterized protein LOC111874456 isoform X2 [Cryptotermes secundus]PNF14800.1 hypothetical protein B7P43_G07017 [Cryptotermes secundus]